MLGWFSGAPMGAVGVSGVVGNYKKCQNKPIKRKEIGHFFIW